MIYFIKSGNYCKVGYSRDKKSFFTRMKDYLTHNPLFQVLDIFEGDQITEHLIQNEVPSKLKHYGEWFLWSEKVAETWIRFTKRKIKGTWKDYFKDKSKRIHKMIVYEKRYSKQENFLRYFAAEQHIDFSEPDLSEWRTP